MLEKIGVPYYEKLSQPNEVFLDCLRQRKAARGAVTAAEIGVGIGATAQQAMSLLKGKDVYYLFDYQDTAIPLCEELKLCFPHGADVRAVGNSRCTADSYVWPLSNLCLGDALFDAVLLDGAHDLTVDLAAAALLTQLLRPDGVLVVDDVQLTAGDVLRHNPRYADKWEGRYAPDQLEIGQMGRLCQVFLDRHPQLLRIPCEEPDIAVYQKLPQK